MDPAFETKEQPVAEEVLALDHDEEPEYIALISTDGAKITFDKHQIMELSPVVKHAFENDPEAKEVPVDVDGHALQVIAEWCMLDKKEAYVPPEPPLKKEDTLSDIFKQSQYRDFVKQHRINALDHVQAANYFAIERLIHLWAPLISFYFEGETMEELEAFLEKDGIFDEEPMKEKK